MKSIKKNVDSEKKNEAHTTLMKRTEEQKRKKEKTLILMGIHPRSILKNSVKKQTPAVLAE